MVSPEKEEVYVEIVRSMEMRDRNEQMNQQVVIEVGET